MVNGFSVIILSPKRPGVSWRKHDRRSKGKTAYLNKHNSRISVPNESPDLRTPPIVLFKSNDRTRCFRDFIFRPDNFQLQFIPVRRVFWASRDKYHDPIYLLYAPGTFSRES